MLCYYLRIFHPFTNWGKIFHCSKISDFLFETMHKTSSIVQQLWLFNWDYAQDTELYINITLKKLEALRERRPPWPRQIITLILSTVKMLSLGCERLPTILKKKKKKKKVSGSLPAPWSGCATTIMLFFCSFTHLAIPRSPPKFNQFFLVLLRTRP